MFMKKIIAFIFVLNLVFGGLCARFFGSSMMMSLPTAHAMQDASSQLSGQAQHISCCESAHPVAQKIFTNLTSATEKISSKIFVLSVFVAALTVFSLQLISGIFPFQKKNYASITISPPGFMATVIKRE